jgi:phage terminase Nu1 subunit (DNA packaging protein)
MRGDMVDLAALNISSLRKANKAQVAEFFDVSMATVDAWLRRGCPYIQQGNKGLAWVIDLRAAAEWYFKGASEKAAATSEDPEKLSPKERLDWYRGARERTKHLEECGELMKAADYETDLASALKSLAVGLESFPDQLERDVGLSGEGVEVVQRLVDRLREDLHQRLTQND